MLLHVSQGTVSVNMSRGNCSLLYVKGKYADKEYNQNELFSLLYSVMILTDKI